MEPIQVFEKAEFSKENFVPKQLHIGETSAAVLICFEPGQTMPIHPHPGALEVILYGVEGEGVKLWKSIVRFKHAGTQIQFSAWSFGIFNLQSAI